MRKISLLSFFFLFFSLGCASAVFTDVKITKALNSGQLHIGQTKEEVAKITGKPSIGCIKTKITEDGTYTMWDFATKGCALNFADSYVLIFKNNKLIEIKTVSNVSELNW